jgi:hypothetical protein
MIVADTSGLLCLLDAGEREHGAVRDAIAATPGPLVTIDFVLAEVDHLLLARLGPGAERAFLGQLRRGALLREPVTDADLARAQAIVERYEDQRLGLTDAALMAVAERLRPAPVLTLDRRHFAPFRDRHGRPLSLLPE